MPLRLRYHPGLASLTFLLFLTCSSGGRGGGPVAPVVQTGSIRVTTTTTGEEGSLDRNGFTLVVDGLAPRSIASNGAMNFLDLSAGSHTVRLDGAAENCEIGGENPRNATVLAGEAVQVAFTITCATVTGTIVVKTITTGGLDPDGYTISIDGGASQPITDTEPKTFAGLATGRHDLLLGGLDAGCTLNQPNPHSLILIGSGMSTVNFHVACPIT